MDKTCNLKTPQLNQLKNKTCFFTVVVSMDTDEVLIDTEDVDMGEDVEMDFDGPDEGPQYEKLKPSLMENGRAASRKIPVPAHRYTPLKQDWVKICTPIVHNLHLQIRMNTRTRHIEIRTSELTEDIGSLQRAADFVKAYMLGFDAEDAVAILRIEDLFIDSFEVEDVKMLHGDHLSRAIGRVAGKDGRTKFAIENATKTRIVVADKHIHILGSFANIKIARDAICALIMGSPPGKVYARLRQVSSRVNERF